MDNCKIIWESLVLPISLVALSSNSFGNTDTSAGDQPATPMPAHAQEPWANRIGENLSAVRQDSLGSEMKQYRIDYGSSEKANSGLKTKVHLKTENIHLCECNLPTFMPKYEHWIQRKWIPESNNSRNIMLTRTVNHQTVATTKCLPTRPRERIDKEI